MRTVELKLFEWRRLYGDLSDAERRLREVQGGRGDESSATVELELEVRRLRQESDGALDALNAALAAKRARAAERATI